MRTEDVALSQPSYPSIRSTSLTEHRCTGVLLEIRAASEGNFGLAHLAPENHGALRSLTLRVTRGMDGRGACAICKRRERPDRRVHVLVGRPADRDYVYPHSFGLYRDITWPRHAFIP